jgi:creatinine amidohydrolase
MKRGETSMSVLFAEKSWPEIGEYVKRKALAILPVGQVEEHGPHLPLNTDIVIAEGVALAVAHAIEGRHPVLVLPGVWSGYSLKKMNRWPGVMSIRSEVLTEYIFDIFSSLADMGFRKILTINAHGMNPEIIKLAARRISDRSDLHVATTSWWTLAAATVKRIRKSEIGGELHGGEFETSLMLYLSDLVDMSKATNTDFMRYRSDFYAPDMFASAPGGTAFSTWYVQESKTGVYGDPTKASKETGEAVMKGTVEMYVRLIDDYMRI